MSLLCVRVPCRLCWRYFLGFHRPHLGQVSDVMLVSLKARLRTVKRAEYPEPSSPFRDCTLAHLDDVLTSNVVRVVCLLLVREPSSSPPGGLHGR